MDEFDPLWLDTIRDGLIRVLTGGYLNVHPWVTGLLTTTLILSLFFGMCAMIAYAFHPIVLIRVGDVILRVAALWAIGMNWNFLFDGFMNSLVSLGLRIGGSTMTTAEFLSPGRILLQGIRLSTNFYLILMNMSDDVWYAPVLWFVYFWVWLAMILVSGIASAAVLLAEVEFLYISVYAFLMWPLMPIEFLSWIADSVVRLLIAAALRLGGLAGLVSILLPFLVDLGVPGTETPSVQSAMSLGVGMGIFGYIIWHGPKMFGAAAWPGSGLVTLGMLTWFGLRGRRA